MKHVKLKTISLKNHPQFNEKWLQDADGHGRYEVEIQLGSTDESHIIRTIEYWDIEKRKYPQYEHPAKAR